MSTAVAQLVPPAALCELALFLKFTLAQDSLQRKQLYPPHYSRTDLVITLLHVLVLFHPGFSDVSCSFRPLLLRSYLVWNMKTSFSRALSTLGMVPGLLRGLRRAYSSEAAQASLASPCLFLKYLAVTSSGRCGSCLVPIVPCTFTWLLKCFLTETGYFCQCISQSPDPAASTPIKIFTCSFILCVHLCQVWRQRRCWVSPSTVHSH